MQVIRIIPGEDPDNPIGEHRTQSGSKKYEQGLGGGPQFSWSDGIHKDTSPDVVEYDNQSGQSIGCRKKPDVLGKDIQKLAHDQAQAPKQDRSEIAPAPDKVPQRGEKHDFQDNAKALYRSNPDSIHPLVFQVGRRIKNKDGKGTRYQEEGD